MDQDTVIVCENNFCTRTQAYPMIEGVRTRRWKYIRYTDLTPVVEALFDLAHDPHETTNFANEPEYDTVMNEMHHLLRVGWESCVPNMS